MPGYYLVCMAKTWVLDTETKGTGAHIVPLSDARPERRPRGGARARAAERAPRAPREPSRGPREGDLPGRGRARREALGEELDARDAVADAGQACAVRSTRGCTSARGRHRAGGCSASPTRAGSGSWPANGRVAGIPAALPYAPCARFCQASTTGRRRTRGSTSRSPATGWRTVVCCWIRWCRRTSASTGSPRAPSSPSRAAHQPPPSAPQPALSRGRSAVRSCATARGCMSSPW